MTGSGFQGFGPEGARARRESRQKLTKADLLEVLRQVIDPRGPIRIDHQGLMVHFDANSLSLIPGSPPRLAARVGTGLTVNNNGISITGATTTTTTVVSSGGGYPLALGYLSW